MRDDVLPRAARAPVRHGIVAADATKARSSSSHVYPSTGELAGMLSVERDIDSEVLYGRLAAIAPKHRGAHLSRNIPLLEEALGRAMGVGMVYGLATLRYPHMQATFERMGWRLIGITPGFDKEVVAPGIVKRVYEAIYAKVLVAEDNLLRPRAARRALATPIASHRVQAIQRSRPSARRGLRRTRCAHVVSIYTDARLAPE